MSTIDSEGMLLDERVTLRRFKKIEHGALDGVSAIVVHQTDAPTADQTFSGYLAGGNGAHFLIDKTGEIYQTASIKMRCYHVGRLIRSKCLTISRSSCSSAPMTSILAMKWTRQIQALDALEREKAYPERYPVNSDSVGIELVGAHVSDKQYEAVTALQNASLQWLLGDLYRHFSVTSADVYRHPEVSYKNPGEAATAVWK